MEILILQKLILILLLEVWHKFILIRLLILFLFCLMLNIRLQF